MQGPRGRGDHPTTRGRARVKQHPTVRMLRVSSPHEGLVPSDARDARDGRDGGDGGDGDETSETPFARLVTAPIPAVVTKSSTVPALQRHDTPAEEVTPIGSGGERATLSMICGPSAGASFTLDEQTLIGRDEDVDVFIEDAAMSRKHASIRKRIDGRYVLRDLDSTNGTFVSGLRAREVVLENGDRIQLGPNIVLRFAVIDELEDVLQKRMYESATRDALTGALNRQALADRLEIEVTHARRTRAQLSALMLDVDEFKLVNDHHGHLAGDAVLRSIGRCVTDHLRREDLVARYGGEELVVIARATALEDARVLSERIRKAIESLRLEFEGAIISTTVSIGVAALSELVADATIDALLARADARLYCAKLAGRNRTCAQG